MNNQTRRSYYLDWLGSHSCFTVLFLITSIALSLAVMIPNVISGLSYGEPWYVVKMLIRTAHCMSCIFTILSFAHRYLNYSCSTFKNLNEAVLPFYILHQADMVPVGFYVTQTGWTMGIKYLVTAATSLAIIILTYAVVRRSNVLRFVFGDGFNTANSSFAESEGS